MEQKNVTLEKKKNIFLIAKIVTTLLLTAIWGYTFFHKELYTVKETQVVEYYKPVILLVLVLLTSACVWIKNPLTQKKNRIALPVVVFISGILTFIGMELLSGDLTQIRHLIGLINPILIFFFMMTIYALCNRIKPAAGITITLCYVFAVANFFTDKFRGIPILASDLALVNTAFSVAGEFDYSVDFDVITYTVLFILCLVLLCKVPEKEKLNLKWRLGYLGGYAVILCGFLYAFVFSDTLEKLDVDVQPFNPRRSYISNGALLTFARSFQMISIDEPDGYSVEKVQELAQPYIEGYEQDQEAYHTPNVIVIMNEAFSDLQSITPFETNVDVMPVIHSLSENTIKGTAYSSVFGGKTVNSEYEFLTGHSTVFLNDMVPFQFLIKKPMSNINSYLVNCGYEGFTAIHPYLERGYNRNTAYKYLGFNKFISKNVMDENRQYVRKFISDADDMGQMIAEYESLRAQTDAPLYLYTVTMQNHSPWDEEYDNFTPDVKVLDEEYSTPEVENYLSLIKLSDASLGMMIDYFSQVEEDTVIVFFGDHQPKLANSYYSTLFGKSLSDLTQEETMEKYKVPYVIWANYDIEEKDYGDISLNYLSTVMMEAAGMKLAPYNRFLQDLREEIPVLTVNGYWDKNGEFYGEVDENSPYKELLDLYEYTQYNNLIDTTNRVENFFD